MIFETWVIVFVEAFVFKTSWLYWLCSICSIYPVESYLSEYIFTIKKFKKIIIYFRNVQEKMIANYLVRSQCRNSPSSSSNQRLSFWLKVLRLHLCPGPETGIPVLIPEKPPTRPLTENFRTQSKAAAPLERVCPVLLHREPLSRYSVSFCLCVEAGFLLSLSMLADRYWAFFRHYLSSDSHTLC